MAKPNIFKQVEVKRPPTNVFDLSHDVKLSCEMGKLIPTAVIEAMPGDIFGISCESLLRFAPLLAPIMHRVDVTMHYFFVPNRILWPNWEDFITNTKIGTPEALPVHPYLDLNTLYTGIGSLPDYMGIPPTTGGGGSSVRVSALPFAAYQMIYNEYYRDQNLIDDLTKETPSIILSDGDNVAKQDPLTSLRIRAWEHDYFTSCLPFAQKGDAVDIPLGEVVLDPTLGQEQLVRNANDHTLSAATDAPLISGTGGVLEQNGIIDPGSKVIDPNGTWNVEATTINDLRLAYTLQRYLEKQARGGTRYIENILQHFDVKSSDKRLQRPEYITGIKTPVTISEVLNTTGTAENPQGNMAGHAVSVTTGNYGKYFCEEHGFIMGIMSITPKTAYQQGIHKLWSRISGPTDYPWPVFANIGEQEVLNKEIFAWQGAADNDVFGYVPRYAELKFMPNRVAGEFRSTLNYWHLGRIFASAPALNQEFIECVPSTRIFAVEAESDPLWCQIYHKIKAIRRLPYFGTPI